MRRTAEGVFQADAGLVHLGPEDVALLEDDAPTTQKMRSRILAHQAGDGLHVMLIAFSKGSWNPWHSHEKAEAVYVISGALQVRLRDQAEVNLLAGEFLLVPGGVEHQPIPLADTVILEIAEK